jgi:SPP1 family predicted phage head-tail adaptor
MKDLTTKLITKQFVIDEVGNQVLQENYTLIPIIDVEDVYQSEFYNAAQQGLKPTLRLRISDLNYNNEPELEYMNYRYSIIRVDMINNEEIALVCEKRSGINGNVAPSV